VEIALRCAVDYTNPLRQVSRLRIGRSAGWRKPLGPPSGGRSPRLSWASMAPSRTADHKDFS